MQTNSTVETSQLEGSYRLWGGRSDSTALSAELDRRVAESEPNSWSEVVDLGLGVARAVQSVLGEEPCRDPRPWVRGFDQAVSQASSRKRKADSEAAFRAASYDVRRCKRRRSAWLREKAVVWWDSQAQLVQDKADQGDAFGVFATFKELRNRGASVHLGDVRPADADAERDAWAEHLRLIGKGKDWFRIVFGINIPSYSPMETVWGHAPAPNELHAALRQMSLGCWRR